MNNTNAIFLLMILSALLVAGCAGKPFKYQSDTEIPEGPGVFSKDEGEFTIYNNEENKGKNPDASEPATAADTANSTERESKFEEDHQWKQEKSELEEFRKWKKSAEGSKEYEDFQQWKQWKEYKEWQKAQ